MILCYKCFDSLTTSLTISTKGPVPKYNLSGFKCSLIVLSFNLMKGRPFFPKKGRLSNWKRTHKGVTKYEQLPKIQYADRNPEPNPCKRDQKVISLNSCPWDNRRPYSETFFLPNDNVGRASFRYMSGSWESFPSQRLFHANTTPITVGPRTIWFKITWRKGVHRTVIHAWCSTSAAKNY